MTSLTPEEITAGWKPNKDRKCPVDGETLVTVRFANGYSSRVPKKAKEWIWESGLGTADITAYRVIEQHSADKDAKERSTGGSTDYYRLPGHATELRHLISHKGMSKSRGDIFKACYRLGEKDGADILYDINKIIFFAQDLKEMYERGERM